MTLKDIVILMETLTKEINEEIDVEFNKRWLKALRNSISKSFENKTNKK